MEFIEWRLFKVDDKLSCFVEWFSFDDVKLQKCNEFFVVFIVTKQNDLKWAMSFIDWCITGKTYSLTKGASNYWADQNDRLIALWADLFRS